MIYLYVSAIGRALRSALRDPGVCVVLSVEGVLSGIIGVSKKSNFYQHHNDDTDKTN